MRAAFILDILYTLILTGFFVLFVYPSFSNKKNINENISVCFTPGDNCRKKVIDEISSAKSYLQVQAYQLTDPDVINAIIQDKSRGVDVFVILDKTQYSKSKELSGNLLAKAGIPVFIDRKVVIAHNKVILIDQKEVITGSYNFSLAAQNKNAENLLIIDNRQIEKLYEDNFKKRLKLSDLLPNGV